ncbi:multiheme c-type cytochrome (plasmid) [Aliisedimentitalea scapharcae]|uniref:Multiheme c-type cytochrome n=1 Tax=Aliisedimentitalea scapharcae TaxID=1524259 RepID=A0ABZ2XZ18_9RHOB
MAHAEQFDRPNYVGSQSCGNCHDQAMQDWQKSHHAQAWTEPSEKTVVGAFDGRSFSHQGMTTRFRRKDGQYIIETDDIPGGKRQFPVVGVGGIAPLQQYIVETEPGRMQSFDVVWDVEQERWYHLYPDQELVPEDGLHWSGPYKNWNARCAECHATGFEKNYDPKRDLYQSTQVETGVGCEACHGPAQAHVEWAEAGTSLAKGKWSGVNGIGLLVNLNLTDDGQSAVRRYLAGTTQPLSRLTDTEVQIQQCASCHSRREPFEGGNPLPGTPFHDAYRLSILRPGLYHADGQILDEVYVYGSFLQSKMYANGVTCSNCHDPHTAQLKAEGNAVCTQCHSPAGNPDFPSLTAKEYDHPSHTFHLADTAGSECKSCHMIERNYMGVDGRRDHSFRVPRPDLSLETRAPNACNDCHDDQSARWAAGKIADWFPDSSRREERHFSQTFAAARTDLRSQRESLIMLAEYDQLPGIVRATALDMLLPIADPGLATRADPMLSDPDPLVRVSAIALQRGAPEVERSARLAGLLEDPVKAVRIAAARGFLGMRIAYLPPRINENLGKAMGDWQSSLKSKADFPEAQMVLAGIGLTTRRMEIALSAFGEAVDMDPQLTQAWSMMVRIHSAMGNRQAALETVNSALEANPDDVPLNLMRADLGG